MEPAASRSSRPELAPTSPSTSAPPSRYESQKRRDWNTFLQYLRNHKPPLTLTRCSGAQVLEFLKYLDQFGKTKVHVETCPFFGHPDPPSSCSCPHKQAWGSLDALIGRLRAAYEENGGRPDSNPFAARAVRIYLREVKESQAKARGIPYEKKKRKRQPTVTTVRLDVDLTSGVAGDGSKGGSTAVPEAVLPLDSNCFESGESTDDGTKEGLVHQVTDRCGDACACIPKRKTKKMEEGVCCLSTCQVKVLNILGYRGTCGELKQMRHFLETLECLETVNVGV